MTDNLFPEFHKYRRLSKLGKVEALRHRCGAEYTLTRDDKDNLVLWCVDCNEKTVPGQATVDRVRKAID